jgi:hypothetical protein
MKNKIKLQSVLARCQRATYPPTPLLVVTLFDARSRGRSFEAEGGSAAAASSAAF